MRYFLGQMEVKGSILRVKVKSNVLESLMSGLRVYMEEVDSVAPLIFQYERLLGFHFNWGSDI